VKRNLIDFISEEFDDYEIEELDFTESAMYERAFKKFYYRKSNPKKILEDDNDCMDIEDEELEIEVKHEDTEIEEEDIDETE